MDKFRRDRDASPIADAQLSKSLNNFLDHFNGLEGITLNHHYTPLSDGTIKAVVSVNSHYMGHGREVKGNRHGVPVKGGEGVSVRVNFDRPIGPGVRATVIEIMEGNGLKSYEGAGRLVDLYDKIFDYLDSNGIADDPHADEVATDGTPIERYWMKD